MRHRLLVTLLALGAIGGYAAGFASLHAHHRHHACCAGHAETGPNAAAAPESP
jgi:hypothetical protein